MSNAIETPVELKFCDLCGISIPQKDLEAGLTQAANGKTVGACCLAKLLAGQPAAKAASGPANPATALSVAFGVGVVIAAIAGAAWFVDSRANERDGRKGVEELSGQVAAFKTILSKQSKGIADQHDEALKGLLKKVEASMDGVKSSVTSLRSAMPKRDDSWLKVSGKLVELTGQLRDISAAQGELRSRMTASFAAFAARLKGVATDARDSRRKAMARDPSTVTVGPSKKISSLPEPLGRHVDQLGKGDAGERWSAVDELIRSGDKRVVPYLVPTLTDEDPFVRRLSAEGLGQLADKHSCSVLISALEDKEAIVREAAFKALVKLSAKRIPFDPEASETQRRTMVKRWRAWWDKEAKK
ncbi:MAG: hypothetical protein CMJ85_10605 [Planctomycetes bacterium]|nr:hypothetical protein [Planctomycetota bacterium]